MIELVAGGARSGKSSYALQIAEGIPGNHISIATAEAHDVAMQQRIERHQQERSSVWQLLETPLDMASAVRQHGAGNILLIDCLTLWLTNWLCAETSESESWLDGWDAQKNAFLEALEDTSADVVLVTNEVGQGVVPMGKLSRDFVDHAGWLHQAVAAVADNVTLVTFGIPQQIKSSN